MPKGVASAADASKLIFNDHLDAAVTTFFMVSVLVILAASAFEWWKVISGRKLAVSTEIPFEPRVALAGD